MNSGELQQGTKLIINNLHILKWKTRRPSSPERWLSLEASKTSTTTFRISCKPSILSNLTCVKLNACSPSEVSFPRVLLGSTRWQEGPLREKERQTRKGTPLFWILYGWSFGHGLCRRPFIQIFSRPGHVLSEPLAGVELGYVFQLQTWIVLSPDHFRQRCPSDRSGSWWRRCRDQRWHPRHAGCSPFYRSKFPENLLIKNVANHCLFLVQKRKGRTRCVFRKKPITKRVKKQRAPRKWCYSLDDY